MKENGVIISDLAFGSTQSKYFFTGKCSSGNYVSKYDQLL